MTLMHEPMLTSGEVATLFGVGRTSVHRWGDQGKLSVHRTLGGHRRYLQSEVETLLGRRVTEARR